MVNKVVILVPCLSIGGAEKQISLLAPKLHQDGFHITVISMIPPDAFQDLLASAGIELLTLNMKKGVYSLSSFFQLVSLLKKINPQQLVTFNFPANITGRAIKLFIPKIKLITSIRSSTFGSAKRSYLMKISRVLDKYTVPNSFIVAHSFLENGVIDEKRLRVIQNAVTIDQTADALADDIANIRTTVLKRPEDFLWVAVGRHELPKDYPSLLNACSMLIEAGVTNWHLVVVGSGDLTPMLIEMIKTLNLTEYVTFVGRKKLVLPYYYASNAYVSSSAWEGMPNALVEAMMAGLPVLSTSVGEVPNILEDGYSGFKVEPKNPEALFSMMKKMTLMDVSELSRLGKNAHTFAMDNFNIGTIVSKWKEILN